MWAAPAYAGQPARRADAGRRTGPGPQGRAPPGSAPRSAGRARCTRAAPGYGSVSRRNRAIAPGCAASSTRSSGSSRGLPVQFPGGPTHGEARDVPALGGRLPGCEQPARTNEQDVADERERDDEHETNDDLGGEVALV